MRSVVNWAASVVLWLCLSDEDRGQQGQVKGGGSAQQEPPWQLDRARGSAPYGREGTGDVSPVDPKRTFICTFPDT